MTVYNKLTKFVYRVGHPKIPGKIISKLDDGRVRVEWLNGNIETLSPVELLDLEFVVEYYKKELRHFQTALITIRTKLGE